MKLSSSRRQPAVLILLGILLAGLASTAGAVTLDDVIRLKLAGVGEETILHVVEIEGGLFYLSVDDIIDLRQAGASDELIRALMDTVQSSTETATYRGDYAYDSDWEDAYDLHDPYGYDDYTLIFTNYYYDPFAYHWHAWPRYYVYYSPFWWSRAGFYYAGFWSHDWWDPWSACAWYCDWHWGYRHHFGRSHTRAAAGRTWHRVREATASRIDRQDQIYRRAGLSAPPRSAVRARTVASTDRLVPRDTATRSSRITGRRPVLHPSPRRSSPTTASSRQAKRSAETVRRSRSSSAHQGSSSSASRRAPSYRPANPSNSTKSRGSSSPPSVSRSRSRSADSSHSSRKSAPARARKR